MGAAKLVKSKGARQIHVASTHGVFAGEAISRLNNAPIDSVVVTDSIPLPAHAQIDKVKVLTISGVLGEAIRRIHHDQSISAIFA